MYIFIKIVFLKKYFHVDYRGLNLPSLTTGNWDHSWLQGPQFGENPLIIVDHPPHPLLDPWLSSQIYDYYPRFMIIMVMMLNIRLAAIWSRSLHPMTQLATPRSLQVVFILDILQIYWETHCRSTIIIINYDQQHNTAGQRSLLIMTKKSIMKITVTCIFILITTCIVVVNIILIISVIFICIKCEKYWQVSSFQPTWSLRCFVPWNKSKPIVVSFLHRCPWVP